MTQRQINSLTMYKTVLQFLKDNNTVWSANAIISNAVTAFSSSVDAIQLQAVKQQSSSKNGYTEKKDQDLENLINLAYRLALRVKNYAVNINDPVLKHAVDFSRRELETGKEVDVVNRCVNIVAKANSVAGAAPAEFKITPELIEQVSNAAALIEPDIAQRDVASGTRSGATTQLGTLFTTARNQLAALDDLVEADADDDASDFVHNYFFMRKTVDRRGGKSKAGENGAATAAA